MAFQPIMPTLWQFPVEGRSLRGVRGLRGLEQVAVLRGLGATTAAAGYYGEDAWKAAVANPPANYVQQLPTATLQPPSNYVEKPTESSPSWMDFNWGFGSQRALVDASANAAPTPYPPTLGERASDFWTGVTLGKPLNLALLGGGILGVAALVRVLTKDKRAPVVPAPIAGFFGMKPKRKRSRRSKR